MLDTPIIVLVVGEGGSGGALGIAVGDRVLMQEFSVYSVIPPEGGAAILWRDSKRKVEAAEALKITAPDLRDLGLIDEIVKEPVGAAHVDPDSAARLVDEAIARHLGEVQTLTPAERLDARYRKFRAMGRLGHSFEDIGAVPDADSEPRTSRSERASASAPAPLDSSTSSGSSRATSRDDARGGLSNVEGPGAKPHGVKD